MSVESGHATSSSRLQALASAVSQSLPEMRQCYSRVTKRRPTIEGTMHIRVALPMRGRAQVEIRDDSVSDATLSACVLRTMRRTPYTGIERPAEAVVALAFTNTAAAGAEVTAARREREDNVRVVTNSAGLAQARGGTGDGEVQFVVTAARPDTSADAVAAVQRTIRAALPGLLDCRRRASRRDQNPQGETRADLTVTRTGTATIQVTNTTVAEARTPICVTNALRRARFPREAAGKTTLAITFAPMSP